MPQYLDLETWPRKSVFEFFLHFDKPYFNICVQLDVTKLLALRSRTTFSPFLAYHYLALRMMNEVEPFHYRLRQGKVLIHEVVNGGSTLLLPDETFSFVYFDYHDDFDQFARETTQAMDQVRTGEKVFQPRDDYDALVHFTTLPWITFTSFSHARNWGREDSVPKLSFGRFTKQNDTVLLPMSVEVHHALMDGLHVGRFVNKMEAALDSPESFLVRTVTR
jgi:chloramphenicol O-acetyltransferase type A